MSSLDAMKKRVNYNGGDSSDKRIVKGKYLSFLSSLNNSYQAEDITFNNKKYRCLINPDKLSSSYDQKTISIDFNSELKNGSVFYWDRTKYHWITFLQKEDEEAYFRASIRKCRYKIAVGGQEYWIYARGPQEDDLSNRTSNSVSLNNLNYSLFCYITKDEITDANIKRHGKIIFEGHNYKIVAVNRFSQDGIIEFYLLEDYDNEFEESEKIEEDNVSENTSLISGNRTVKPYDKNIVYSIVGVENGTFSTDSKKVKIVSSDNTNCIIDVTTGRSGSFTINYKKDNGDLISSLDVEIKSL